ncbi:MAG: hypothetical protein IT204_14080 [Fimbriimonadaceae bacterium]|nr:hypothetical protein [Fimbriimonadaceae bacterium]
MAAVRRPWHRALARRLLLAACDGVAAARRRPARLVLILAHMRSGSTLVNHLLLSHPDVLGCGELNLPYPGRDTCETVRLRILREHRAWLRPPRYFVDQINHTAKTPLPALLDDPSLRLVFLVRQPEPALGSLVRTLGPIYGRDYAEGPDYLLERYAALARLAAERTQPEHSCCLSYEALLAEPQVQLARLTRFLALDPPLTEEYQQTAFTGRRGDPGPIIRTGRITTDKPVHQVDLSPAVREQLRLAHETCWQTLQLACRG